MPLFCLKEKLDHFFAKKFLFGLDDKVCNDRLTSSTDSANLNLPPQWHLLNSKTDSPSVSS